MINMAAIDGALKNYYIEALVYQMDEQSDPLMAMVEKTSKNIQGDKISRYLRYGKNGGVASGPDDGAMPIAGSRKGQQVVTGTKNVFARMEITDKVIKASQGRRGSFLPFLETTMEEMMADGREQVARQVHGDGSGVICTLEATGSSGATVVLADADMACLIYEGMIIDIFTADGNTQKADGVEIINVDRDAGTFTLASAVGSTIADGDILVNQSSKGYELTGLKAILTKNNTIYGLNRANNKWFNPVNMALGGAIDEISIQKAIDTLEIRSGRLPDMLLASYGVRRAYMEYMLTYKRNTNTLDIKGGFKAVDFNGIPMAHSKYRPEGTLALLDTTAFTLDRLDDWSWLDKGGAILTHISNSAKYEATAAMYGDIVCDLSASQALMTGITEA